MSVRRIPLPVITLLAALCAYVLKVRNWYQWDDYHFITINRFAQDPANILQFFTTGHENLYRPLRSLVYLGLHLVKGETPLVYHIAGIGFHLVTVLVVLMIVRRIYQSERAAFFTALLYGVHPMLTGRVVNITGSLDIPGVALTLSAFLLFVMHRETSRPACRIPTWSVAVFAMALLYSEEAVTLLPMVLAYEIAFRTISGRKLLLRLFTIALPFALILVLYAVARTSALGMVGRTEVDAAGYILQLAGTTVVFWLYVLRLLFPLYLSPLYGLNPYDISPMAMAASSAALVFFVLGTFYALKRKGPVGFSLAWFLIALLPFSNLLPTGEMMADRYCYHAAAGFLASVVGALYFTGSLQRKSMQALLAIVAIAFGLLTSYRVHLWKEPLTLWENAVRHAPSCYGARINYGLALRDDAKDVKSADKQFLVAMQINPAKPAAYVNLGQSYLARKEYSKAKAAFRQAVETDPYAVSAFLGLANLEVIGGDLKEAERLANHILAIDTENVSVHNVLGFIAVQDGRLEDAISHYEVVEQFSRDMLLAREAGRILVTLREKVRVLP